MFPAAVMGRGGLCPTKRKERYNRMADLKTIQNPDLILAYHLVQYNAAPERQAEFMQEVIKARFIAPAVIEPAPKVLEDGTAEIPEDATIRFPEVQNSEGLKFFPAFTDWKSMENWELKEGQQVIATTFEDYAAIVLRDPQTGGFVINPFGENIRIGRDAIRKLKDQQMSYLKRKILEAQKNAAKPPISLSFHQIEKCPEPLLEAARDFLKGYKVKAAYIQGVMQGDKRGCVFVIDHEDDEKAIFTGLAQLARPYMSGMYLYAASLATDLGKKASEGIEPFYQA